MSHHSHRSINISNVLRTKKNNLINILIRSSHVKDSLLLSLQLVRMGLLLLTKATVAAKHNNGLDVVPWSESKLWVNGKEQ